MPLDLAPAVDGFLGHWRPDLVLWTESEFWPAAIAATAATGAPLVLLNGRVSARAFARWARLKPLAAGLLAGFSLCLAQSRHDERRLAELGARQVRYLGNLKWTAPPLAADGPELARLGAVIGARPRWLAASTHPGEEMQVLEADRVLRAGRPDLLTILVPRHPGRGAEISGQLRASGAKVALRSRGEAPDAAVEIYVADTMGEMGLWYRLAPAAFIGGSLVAHGGQNPLEPSRLGCALVHGPHMENFAEIAATLDAAGASRAVGGGAELASVIAELLFADQVLRQGMTERARAAVAEADGALDRVMDALAPFLDRLAPRTLSSAA
jgi:3-deoxy-D-manno-octulosonic-acid transferase